MIIIKLGGSAITDKSDPMSFNRAATSELIAEIKHADKKIIAVHGAGSFAHPIAQKYQLCDGLRDPRQLEGVAKCQSSMRLLNLTILDIFADNNINATSLPASAICQNNNKELEKLDVEPFEHYLKYNITPITFGDIVPDKTLGFSIVSGDQLAEYLALHTQPEKVIFVTDVDGVFKKDPKQGNGKKPELIEEISDPRALNAIQFGSTSVCDVTGGMLNKVKTAIEISKAGIDIQIINSKVKGRLTKALMNEKVVGTLIKGAKNTREDKNGETK